MSLFKSNILHQSSGKEKHIHPPLLPLGERSSGAGFLYNKSAHSQRQQIALSCAFSAVSELLSLCHSCQSQNQRVSVQGLELHPSHGIAYKYSYLCPQHMTNSMCLYSQLSWHQGTLF